MKHKTIIIVPLPETMGGHIVWTDLDFDVVRSVEGVDNVYGRGNAKLEVLLDPRYDADEVLNEIRRLAEAQAGAEKADQ